MKANFIKSEALSPQESKISSKTHVFGVPSYVRNQNDRLIFIYQKYKSSKTLEIILDNYKNFIKKKAKKYQNYTNFTKNFGLNDLESESRIAFIRSINKFDPNKGYQLASYASNFIDGHLKDFIIENFYSTKISKTAEFKKIFFKIKDIKKILNIEGNIIHEDDVKKVSKIINGSLKMTGIILNFIQNNDFIYDECEEEDGLLNNICINEILKSNEETFKDNENSVIQSNLFKYQKKIISSSLEELGKIDKRQKEVIISRYFNQNKKLNNLAKNYNISPQRVSYIEKQAIKNLKKIFFKNNIQSVELF